VPIAKVTVFHPIFRPWERGFRRASRKQGFAYGCQFFAIPEITILDLFAICFFALFAQKKFNRPIPKKSVHSHPAMRILIGPSMAFSFNKEGLL